MKSWIGRLFLAIWFVGIVAVAVRGTSAQGAPPFRGEMKQYFPTMMRNIPIQLNPPLRSYVGIGTSLVDGNHEIYMVRADGSDPTRLTTTSQDEDSPSFSPDGLTIVFLQGQTEEPNREVQLMIMNRDGSGTRALLPDTFDNVWIQWSPNGQTLLVLGASQSPYTIYQLLNVSVNGSVPPELLTEKAEPLLWGWSPDGRYFHYGHKVMGGTELWVRSAMDGEAVRLSDHAYQAVWHPYRSEVLLREYAIQYGGDVGRVASPDGSTTREVYRGSDRVEGWLLQGQAVLLHDGRNLSMVPYNGGDVQPMTDFSGGAGVGGISPDGSAVVYLGVNTGETRGFYLHVIGENPRFVQECSTCSFTSTSWAQDGSGVLSIVEFGERVRNSGMLYVSLEVGVESEAIFSSGNSWNSTWTGMFFPFSSAFGVAQYIGGYPPPESELPQMITLPARTITPLPFPNPQFRYSEWRYMP